jgi:hypothetical protein
MDPGRFFLDHYHQWTTHLTTEISMWDHEGLFELGSMLSKFRRNMTSFLNIDLILEKKLRVVTCLYHDDMLKINV